MTASHCFYNGQSIDLAVNYEDVLKQGLKPDYDINDPGFKSLLECVALGSKATFSYNPTLDDIKNYIAK